MPGFYPTKEFILHNPIQHKTAAIQCVEQWRRGSPQKKHNQIKQLLHQLAKIYGVSISVMFDGQAKSAYCRRVPGENNYITLNNHSIITALHEFAHALYGGAESTACRWSIWLFIKTFPHDLEHLVWEGHMLKRKNLDAQKKPTLAATLKTEPSCGFSLGPHSIT